MKRLYIPLILFLLMILEGVALKLLPFRLVNDQLLIVPHWVFVFLLFVTIFYDDENTHLSVLYAVIFGLLIDIVYTGILGVYMFTYSISIYLIHGLSRLLHSNIVSTILFGIIGLMLVDISIEMIFYFVGIIDVEWNDYVKQRLFPTVIANLIFIIIIYPLAAKYLTNWKNEIQRKQPI